MSRFLCSVIVSFLPMLSVAQTQGRLVVYPTADPTAGADAPARVELDLVQAVALPSFQDSWNLNLLPKEISLEGLEDAIDVESMLRRRLSEPGLLSVSAIIRARNALASVSLQRSGDLGSHLGSGFLLDPSVEGGRLRGYLTLLGVETDQALLDVQVDAQILKPAAGQPLPADGGEPWKAILRLREALAVGDEDAFRAHMSTQRSRELPASEAFRTALPELRSMFSDRDRLEWGRTSEVDARLVLVSDSGAEPVRTVVTMVLEDGQWKFDSAFYRQGEEPIDHPQPGGFSNLPAGKPGIVPPGAVLGSLPGSRNHDSELVLRHAIATPIGSIPGRVVVLLTETMLAAEHLGLMEANAPLGPLFQGIAPHGLLIVFDRRDAESRALKTVASFQLRPDPNGEAVTEQRRFAEVRGLLLDGQLYGQLHTRDSLLRFVAPVIEGARN